MKQTSKNQGNKQEEGKAARKPESQEQRAPHPTEIVETAQNPRQATPQAIKNLQRSHGNRFVQRAIEGNLIQREAIAGDLEVGGNLTVGGRVAAGSSMQAGTNVDAGTTILAGSAVQAGTSVNAGTSLSAATDVQGGGNVTVGGSGTIGGDLSVGGTVNSAGSHSTVAPGAQETID